MTDRHKQLAKVADSLIRGVKQYGELDCDIPVSALVDMIETRREGNPFGKAQLITFITALKGEI